MAEQRAILDWLQGALEKIDEMSAKVRRELGIMKAFEYHLIADAVTGKLDMRAASADLDEKSTTDRIGARSASADPNARAAQRGKAMEATS